MSLSWSPEIQKSRNSKIQKFKIQKFKDPEIQKSRNSKIQKFKIQKFKNPEIQNPEIQKSKSGVNGAFIFLIAINKNALSKNFTPNFGGAWSFLKVLYG